MSYEQTLKTIGFHEEWNKEAALNTGSTKVHYIILSLLFSAFGIAFVRFIIDSIAIGGFPNGSIISLAHYTIEWGLSSFPLLIIIGVIQTIVVRFGIVLSIVSLSCVAAIYWMVYSLYVYPETESASIVAAFHQYGISGCLLLSILVPLIFYRLSRSRS